METSRLNSLTLAISLTLILACCSAGATDFSPCQTNITWSSNATYNLSQNNTYYCLNKTNNLTVSAIQSTGLQNSTIDCLGFWLGSSATAINITGAETYNVTVKNCNITAITGILIQGKNNLIYNNTVTNTTTGINIQSNNTTVLQNTIISYISSAVKGLVVSGYDNNITDISSFCSNFECQAYYVSSPTNFTRANLSSIARIRTANGATFNFRNDTGDVWLKSSNEDRALERVLINWNRTNITWKENSTTGFCFGDCTVTPSYMVAGLDSDSYYLLSYGSVNQILTTDTSGSVSFSLGSISTSPVTIMISKVNRMQKLSVVMESENQTESWIFGTEHQVRAQITCNGDDCGNVTVYPRYNISGTEANQAIFGDFLWKANSTGSFDQFGQPSYHDGVLYVPSKAISRPGHQEVFAFNATSGYQLWNTTVGSQDKAPTYWNGKIIVSAYNVSYGLGYSSVNATNSLFVLNANDGSQLCNATIDVNKGGSTSAPNIDSAYSDTTYICSFMEKKCYAFNITDCSNVWTADLSYISGADDSPQFPGSVSIYQDKLFVTHNNNVSNDTLISLNRADGSVNWIVNATAGFWDNDPTIVPELGILILNHGDTTYSTPTVEARYLENGTLSWRVNTTGKGYNTVAYHDGIAYFNSGTSTYAVNATNGYILWNVSNGDIAAFSSVTLTQAGVLFLETGAASSGYVGTLNQTIALNMTNGEKLWSHTMDAGSFSSVTVGGGKVFAISDDWYTYAFDMSWGEEPYDNWDMWRHDPMYSGYSTGLKRYLGPVSCGHMALGDVCNASWSMNASKGVGTAWSIDVLADTTDIYSLQVGSADRTVIIAGVPQSHVESLRQSSGVFVGVKKNASIGVNIASGGHAKVSFFNSSIRSIEIETTNNVSEMLLEVKSVENSPSNEAISSGAVYAYIEISKSNVSDLDIASAYIDFEVNKSWLEKNNIGIGSIALYRLVNDAWTELDTVVTGNDSEKAYYRALTPGFSYFYIGERSIKVDIEIYVDIESNPDYTIGLRYASCVVLVIAVLARMGKPGRRKARKG